MYCNKRRQETRVYFISLLKEIFRKTIHICTALVPFFLKLAYWPTLIVLGIMLAVYCTAEGLRYRGMEVPLISAVTKSAARKWDENRFVLGPVTLAAGVLLTAFLFDPLPAAIGIYALAFGDGLASLAGKFLGKTANPFVSRKTVIGSHACFVAVFLSTYAVSGSAHAALWTAIAGMCIEILPLRDFDNLLIPLSLAALNQLVPHI
ncbi:MAG: phosphatidate cytidylyltransferase [Treponema sp.]|jgi:dolichol kinase|nr:phosphatidate cytidylyltransferase [Treponema sp.]